MKQKRYYYENLLASQNITAKPNVVWAADLTTINLDPEGKKKLHIYICIDIHTNVVVAVKTSINTVTSSIIVKALEDSIRKRFTTVPKNKLIIHTDRGTQFSSEYYNKFVENYREFFRPSMSRPRTPTDNAVIERYIQTFKNHKIDSITVQQKTVSAWANPNFKSYGLIVKRYIKDLNNKPNKKSNGISPQKRDTGAETASILIADPMYTKGFSERFGKDFRVDEIQKYKDETIRISGILDEIAARKAEIVDSTPFDSLDDQIALQIIEERLKDLYSIIKENSSQIKHYVKDVVDDGVQPLEESLEKLHQKVDKLLPNKNTKRQVLPLRDPLDINVYPIFLRHAGSSAKYKQDLKRAQLRITYTILYYVGLRINEIRKLTYKDIQDAIQARQFNIVHTKTSQSHIHILSPNAVEDIQNLSLEFKIVFKQHNYKYLFGKNRPMHKKSLIRMINEDLKTTSETYKLPYNIKSHSFRVNVVSSLLKVTSVQKTAEIIGHEDIRSTLAYKRYALSRNEIENLLQQITNEQID